MISTVSLADEPAMFNPSSFMNINFISIILRVVHLDAQISN